MLVAAAFAFARYLARPLRELSATVERIGRGEAPPPLPEHGPSEIVTLNRGVNRMAANLAQLEHDRALLLAGVSHDLRTPLARLRLGIEMQARDDATRAGMVDDIEEMNRIIGQFLDFARTDEDTAREPRDPNAIVAACVDRYARTGKDVRFAAGAVPVVPLRPTALSRLVANLIDNAIAYGASPVEVTTYAAGGRVVLDVADRGPGIAPGEVERLKQPFTRASAARTDASGRCRRGTRARDRRPHRATARRNLRAPAARRRRHGRAGDDSGRRPDARHFGAIRIAPSMRMTSPFSMTLCTISRTSDANSSGRPKRGGNGTIFASDAFTSGGSPSPIGVSNTPGAIVMTRMPCRASSRAIGSVMPTRPAFDALYAACPICPSKAATDAVIDDHAALALRIGGALRHRRRRRAASG